MYFIVMILFLPCYNVSLHVSSASFFGVNVVTWHSQQNIKKKTSKKLDLLLFIIVDCRVARISQRGEGLFLKFDTTVNELEPYFYSS